MSRLGTLAEQLLGAPAGEHVVRPLDLVYSHDATTPLSIQSFQELGGKMADPSRVAVVFDHMYPAPTIQFAETHSRIRKFVREHQVGHFVPGEGICHLVLPERGLVGVGSVVLGADSHSGTLGAIGAYALGAGSTDIAVGWATGSTWLRVPGTIRVELTGRLRPGVTTKDVNLELLRRLGPDGAVGCALEFGGPGLRHLSMDARFTLPNMAVELGADTGLVECDEVTAAWLTPRRAPYRELRAAPDASYVRVERIDLSRLAPLVALPPDLTRVVPAAEADAPIDRVFVGSCTNGRHEDIVAFASALGGRRVAVETLVTPGSRAVFDAIARDGTLERLHAAGCTVLAPGCGACLGRHQGVLAAGERVLTTFNRNYPGRMGAVEAEIWLASPHVAAATAVAGRVSAPALALPEVSA